MIEETGISVLKSKYQLIVAEAVKQEVSDKRKAAERAFERIKAKLLAGEFDVMPLSTENVLVNGKAAITIYDQFVVRVDIAAAGEPLAYEFSPWLRDITRQHGLGLSTSSERVVADKQERMADYVYLEAMPG